MRDRAPVFEAAGYSMFGPTALNNAAPNPRVLRTRAVNR